MRRLVGIGNNWYWLVLPGTSVTNYSDHTPQNRHMNCMNRCILTTVNISAWFSFWNTTCRTVFNWMTHGNSYSYDPNTVRSTEEPRHFLSHGSFIKSATTGKHACTLPAKLLNKFLYKMQWIIKLPSTSNALDIWITGKCCHITQLNQSIHFWIYKQNISVMRDISSNQVFLLLWLNTSVKS